MKVFSYDVSGEWYTIHAPIGITLFNHTLSAHSSADDMTLLACFPCFLDIMIQRSYKYFCNWK